MIQQKTGIICEGQEVKTSTHKEGCTLMTRREGMMSLNKGTYPQNSYHLIPYSFKAVFCFSCLTFDKLELKRTPVVHQKLQNLCALLSVQHQHLCGASFTEEQKVAVKFFCFFTNLKNNLLSPLIKRNTPHFIVLLSVYKQLMH